MLNSEQAILNKIYQNISNGIPLFDTENTLFKKSINPLIIKKMEKSFYLRKEQPFQGYEDDDDDDNLDKDVYNNDKVSVESDYYQNEVYKNSVNRKPFEDNIIDKDNSDSRHLVAIDEDNRKLFITFRGSVDSYDWLENLSTVFNRYGITDKINDRLDFNTQQSSLEETEKNIINREADFIDKVILKYPKDYSIIIQGHSKGGQTSMMMLAYLENLIKTKLSPHGKRNIKVYTYNSAPFQFEKEFSHKKLFPRRTKYDLASFLMTINEEHKNLITLQENKDKKFTSSMTKDNILYNHDAKNFLHNYYKDELRRINYKPINLNEKIDSYLYINSKLRKEIENNTPNTTNIEDGFELVDDPSLLQKIKDTELRKNLYTTQIQISNMIINSKKSSKILQKKIKYFKKNLKLTNKRLKELKSEL